MHRGYDHRFATAKLKGLYNHFWKKFRSIPVYGMYNLGNIYLIIKTFINSKHKLLKSFTTISWGFYNYLISTKNAELHYNLTSFIIFRYILHYSFQNTAV